MKSVIVGTDFSKGSYVALEIAVDIANQLKTGIRLLWVKKEKKLLSGEQMEMTEHLAEEKLQQLCEEHRPNLRHGTIEYAIPSGKVASCIADEAHKEDAPMIVIGTNGASGFEKYWMGSTAVRIVQEAPCPTLTIREGFNFHKKLDNIVVPIRINANSRQKVAPAAQMARIFGSHVHILGLIETAQDALSLRTYLKQVEDFFNKEGIPCSKCGRCKHQRRPCGHQHRTGPPAGTPLPRHQRTADCPQVANTRALHPPRGHRRHCTIKQQSESHELR